MNKNLRNIISTVSVITIFTACSHKEVQVYQEGDELLNCKKLTTQIANIIDINSEINDNTGLENKSIATWILWPPFGGLNQVNASIARDKLDARFKYLIKLKQKNSCNITNKEKAFMKYKGRLSDKF